MNKPYILNLTNCNTVEEIYAAIEADMNARKQLGLRKVLTKKLRNLFK